MATVSPGIASAAQFVTQACYITEQDQFDKTVFTSPGRGVNVIFETPSTPIGTDVGIADNGDITLNDANLTYLFTTTVHAINRNANDPSANLENVFGCIIYDVTNDTYPTGGVPLGQTLTTEYTPATAPATLNVIAYTPTGTTWQYPAQLINSRITVQVVDGYTV
jgi:hypothetical protein